MVLDHVILIYVPKMLDEGTYISTLRSANVYHEGEPLYKNRFKNNARIHTGDCIKILVMVTPPMQALLVAMLFRTIHQKYPFMKKKHLRALKTKLQATYGEVQCQHSVRELNIIFIYKH